MSDTGPRVGGAVLCGGASRRMGRDKALLTLDDTPLAERVADAIRRAGIDDPVAIGGDRAGLAAVGLDVIADRWPGEGPLGGILTALHHFADRDVVVVLACDLLRPPPDAIREVVAAIDTGAEVAVPVIEGREQWLFGAWSTSVTTRLQETFDAGARAPRQIEASVSVARLTDLDGAVGVDADTPDDLP